MAYTRVLLGGVVVAALYAGAAAEAGTAGPNGPHVVVSDRSFGNAVWTTPGSAEASDDVYAQVAPAGSPTQYLRATDFGFAIPATAVVHGIAVSIERHSLSGAVADSRVRIVEGGFVGSAERALPGNWPTTDVIATYGGPSDLWGQTWTGAAIDDPAFGTVLSVDGNVDLALVDQVTITVTFSLCGNGVLETGEQCDDGNTSAGDCCSPTCQYEPADTSCGPPTADPCTARTCDAAGACQPLHVCVDQPISGGTLSIARSRSGKEKATFASKDPNALFASPSTGDDPRLAGAQVDLLSANEGTVSFDLPPGVEWWLNPTGTTYAWSNRAAPAGPSPVKVAVIKRGRGIKLSSKATGLPLTGSQGQVAIRIRTGLERSCALFAGPTIVTDEANKFQARDATTAGLADCTDASLGAPSVTTTSTTTIPETTSTTGGIPTTTSSSSTSSTMIGSATTTTLPGAGCPSTGKVAATVTLVPAADGSTASSFSGIKVSLGYPPTVSLPGSGSLPVGDPNDPATREVLLDAALYNGLVIFNDTNTALITTLALSSPETLSAPLAFEQARFDCTPGTPIGAFGCTVPDEADQLGAVIPPNQRPGCQVTVTP